MRPRENKLALTGLGAALGNFLLNFAVAVGWLSRWLWRGVRGGVGRDLAKRQDRARENGTHAG